MRISNDTNLSRSLGAWQNQVTRIPQTPETRLQPQRTSSNLPAASATRVDQVRQDLAVSQQKAKTAIGTINQLHDLLNQVKDKLADPAHDRTALERIVQGARDTTRDILAHAKSEGQPLFAATQTGISQHRAINAYAKNRGAFSTSQQSPDPPGLRYALLHADANLNGPNGLLNSLDRLQPTAPDASAQLDNHLRSLTAILEGFQTSLQTEIEPNLNPQPKSIPYDLAG